ncbi:MAG: hypothetical protein AB7S75_16820 [Desulfococcaceae bacterium]
MSTEETDYSAVERFVLILEILGYVFSPFLFIWSVNTLFQCGIPFSFKTWVAGFVLIMLARYHLKASVKTVEPYDYEFDEDDEEDDDDDGETENINPERKGKVIAYREKKDRKNPPSDTQ